LTQHPLISECGGFAGQGQPLILADPPMPDPATYCDAERLLWAYDAAAGSLGITNSRMLLNCCGNHSIKVVEEAATYVITEVDAPVDGDARCGCMCVFDFAVTVDSIPAGMLPIKLMRHVTDSGEPSSVVYEGTLDLSQATGTITIDPNTVEPWCSGVAP
jgi:hypothetical protein